MGLRYGFRLVFAVASADDALRALAGHLCAEDRARIRAALPWQPATERFTSWRGTGVRERSGFASVERREYEHGDHFCLAQLIRVNHAIREYERENGYPLPREGELARFGCMWTSFSAGSELFVISATAASSSMSRFCASSKAVQAAWKDVASSASGFAVFLDTEEPEQWTLLYPRERTVARPDDEAFELPDDYHPATDAYWSDALDKADVVRTAPRLPGGRRES